LYERLCGSSRLYASSIFVAHSILLYYYYYHYSVYPHGKISIYATILAISNFLFGLSASYGCYYGRVDYTWSELRDGRTTDEGSNIGILAYQDSLRNDSTFTCYPYTKAMRDTFDGPFQAARVFAYMANLCLLVCMIAIVASACLSLSLNALRVLAALYFQAALYEGLTLVFFASNMCDDGGCDFYIGAGVALISSLLAIINGILVLKFPGNVMLDGKDPFDKGSPTPFAPGTQTVTETILPNGKKKIIKTTVNADGSQIVEESIV
jgi:hypothetical protein